MKNLIEELRLALAERFLSLALDIAPKGTRESAALALAVSEYFNRTWKQ